MPGKHGKVTIFLGNWIAGFKGFKLMEINEQQRLFSRCDVFFWMVLVFTMME